MALQNPLDLSLTPQMIEVKTSQTLYLLRRKISWMVKVLHPKVNKLTTEVCQKWYGYHQMRMIMTTGRWWTLRFTHLSRTGRKISTPLWLHLLHFLLKVTWTTHGWVSHLILHTLKAKFSQPCHRRTFFSQKNHWVLKNSIFIS